MTQEGCGLVNRDKENKSQHKEEKREN